MSIDQNRTAETAAEDSSAPAKAEPRGRAWLVVGLLVLLMFVNYADKLVVGLAGVDMKKELGLSSAEFGTIQSSFFALFAVGGIVGGVLTKWVKPRWIILAIAILWSISMLPMAWQVGFGVIIASRVLLGFAEGPTTALAMHVAHSWFPASKRALPSSVIVAGASLGPVVGAPVLTWIITDYDWHAAFLALAVVGALISVLWLLGGREGSESVTAGHGKAADGAIQLPERLPLLRVFSTGTVIGIMLLFFVAYANTAMKVAWLPLYLREGLGYDAKTAGNLVALPYLGGAIAAIAIGVISGMLTKRGISNRITRGVLGASLVLASGVATIGFAAMERGALQMSLIVLSSCLNSAGYGATFAAVSDVAPTKQRGIVLAIITAFFSLSGVIAPLVMGKVVDAAAADDLAAGYSLGFVILGITMIIGALAALFLVNPDRDARKLAAQA